LVQKLQKEMEKAAKNLDFIKAAELRDQIQLLTQD
jgi:excinuclease ABC subunit B